MRAVNSLRLLACTALAVVLLAGAFFALAPQPVEGQTNDTGEEVVRLLRSDADGVVLDLNVPPYAAETIAIDGQAYQRLSVEGYTLGGEPGEPELPQRGFLLGVPPGAEVRLTVLDAESTVARGFRIPPVPHVAVQRPFPAPDRPPLQDAAPDVQYSHTEDPSIYARDAFFPAAVAELGEGGYLRDQRYVQLLVHPLQVNPVTGELRRYHRLTLEVSFSVAGEVRALGASRVESPSFERVLKAALLNYEAARAWRSRPQAQLRATNGAADYLAPPAYKVFVEQDGIYQLTYSDLQAAGLPVNTRDSIDPDTFKLFNMGAEVAIHVETGGDGTFDPGDYLLFYGQKTDTRYTDTNVYWLQYGGAHGLRMETRDGTPGGADPALTFRNTVHLEQDLAYFSDLPMQEGADHWYWDRWRSGHSTYKTRLYETTLAHISTDTHTCALRARLQGESDDTHEIELSVNGTFVGSAMWVGATPHTIEHTFDQSLLQNGPNTITLHTPIPVYAADTGLVNWFEIDYYDTYTAEGDHLRFNGDVSGTGSISHTYNVAGFGDPDIEAFDVTDPTRPKRIAGATVSAGLPFTLTFQDTIAGRTEYLALTTAQRLTPTLGIELDAALDPRLRDPGNGADYIIISHGDFVTDVQPLADHRAAQGLRTVVVDAQEVYDEFAYGVFDARAIRDFLAYAYEHWVPPAPSYVLLVGDGHYDFKDNLGRGEPHYIPPFLAMVDLVAGETAADNRYVTVNGSDIRPEMHIGRFPVNSRAEAQTMVSKTLGYEQNPPPGDWNGRVLFVADNQPDDPGKDAGDFWDLSEDLVTNFLPVPPYTSTRVYYDRWSSSFIPGYPGPPRFPPPFYDSTSGTRSAIVAGINQGHLLVNYIGHGATQVWGQNFLKDEDIDASLANGGMLPVMLPMTCREGYFIYPYGESLDQCMGETFVRVDGKGAVASWSPTGYGCAAGHHLLNQAFFTAVFTDDVREVGLATTLAKRHLYDTGTYLDLMDTYVLFGDPALRLHTLPADVSITKTVDPVGPVLPGDPLSYTLTFTNAGPATAHHVVVTDTLPPELINAAFVSSGAVITPRLGTRFVWDVEDLTAGEGGTITVTATVHPAFSGLISNIARIATTARETDTLNADQAVIVVTHPDAVMITVTPEEGGTLTYTDAQGLTTTIEVPPGAVSEAVTLVFTPLPAPTHPTDLQFAGHAFTLEVYQDGELLSDYAFLAPVDVTIHYSDQDVAGLDESALMLERWNGTAWEDAACGAYDRHPDANWLSVPICHLSQFALLAGAPAVPVGGITLPTAALPRAWRFHAQPVGAEAIALTVAIITMAASALGAERFRRRR